EETITHQFNSDNSTDKKTDAANGGTQKMDHSPILPQYPFITDINACSECKNSNIQLNIMKSNNIEKPLESFQLLEVLVVCNSCHHVEKVKVKSFLG
nr:hypothetical protein [Candidatus Sigynarchaeota archaeon]